MQTQVSQWQRKLLNEELPVLITQTGFISKHKGKAMEILKWVWRACFLLTACVFVWPMLYMQFAFSVMAGQDFSPFAITNLVSLVTTPLLIYIPVEVFFHHHKQTVARLPSTQVSKSG